MKSLPNVEITSAHCDVLQVGGSVVDAQSVLLATLPVTAETIAAGAFRTGVRGPVITGEISASSIFASRFLSPRALTAQSVEPQVLSSDQVDHLTDLLRNAEDITVRRDVG